MYIYRNGVEVKWVQKAVGLPLSISGTTTEGGSGTWTCVLPSFKAQYFENIELEDGYTLESVDSNNKPIYVAIGNSITQGVGQTANATPFTYAWQVAEALGYELYNFAVGGSKVNTQVLDNFEGLNPSLVTVLWGYNDVYYSKLDLSSTLDKYDTLMTELVERYPSAKIVAIEQTYTTTTGSATIPANTISRLRTEERSILDRLSATHGNLLIVNGLDYTDASQLTGPVHLNDDGAKSLADGLISEIKNFKPVSVSDYKQKIASKNSLISLDNGFIKATVHTKNVAILSLVNLQGKIVRESSFSTGSEIKLGTSELPHGVYIARLIVNKKMVDTLQLIF